MKIKLLFLMMLLYLTPAFAQTTEFTYQGRLVENSLPPTGVYDFEFRLYTVETGGTAIAVLQRLNVAVANGAFTVKLDFGSQFTGTARWLEIAVKPSASGGGFQQLLPRQSVSSAPYSIRALNSVNADTAVLAANAQQLGGVGASQFILTTDARLSDSRNPLPNSANYIQNTSAPQAAANFNVIGTGTADVFNALTQFNIGGSRAFTVSNANQNVFAGSGAGASNTTGQKNSFFGFNAGASTTESGNSFFGSSAGRSNTLGSVNSFFGKEAGFSNTTGASNSFFGERAGTDNTTGGENSFFGRLSGVANTTGGQNSFFGYAAGESTTTGSANSFFGYISAQSHTTGNGNSFFGYLSGSANTTGSNNTLLGYSANVSAGNLTYATALGADSVASLSNSIFLGRPDGSDAVRIPGSTVINGSLVVGTLGSAGSTAICLNAANRLSPCSSSLRYKTDVRAFGGGLDVVRRLRPVVFNWKEDGKSDVGFAAEEVNAVEPLLTTTNAKGEIEGVKYGQVTTVLVNAVNEQQIEIERLKEQIKLQQQQLEALKKIVCTVSPAAPVCRD
ncbi:MAG: tail fiber domain-containing protein [Acidobacteria bacterium]|nr:tail fiber domain-containing protein [Acidobacteriota bacterium]